MNRRFNLLPAPYVERMAERRALGVTATALIVLLGLLALAWLQQGRELRQAERRRAVAQARRDALVARRGQLAQVRQLADAIGARERLLTAAMGTEISWAAVLASLARSFPTDASLTSLSAETQLPAFGAPPVKPGDDRSVIGSTALKGYSVRQFTPGVERLLQLLVVVKGLAEPRLQVGTATDIGKQPVTTFEGSAFLDAAALSGRYVQGLPPEDDVELPATAPAGQAAPR